MIQKLNKIILKSVAFVLLVFIGVPQNLYAKSHLFTSPAKQNLAPPTMTAKSWDHKIDLLSVSREDAQKETRERLNKKFLKETIYNPEFVQQERARKEVTWVFDFSGTMTKNPAKMLIQIKKLSAAGIRVVIWTQKTKWNIQPFFKEHPELLSYIDFIITRENFHIPNLNQEDILSVGTQIETIRNLLKSAYEPYFAQNGKTYWSDITIPFFLKHTILRYPEKSSGYPYYETPKDLSLLGYAGIVENNPDMVQAAKDAPLGPFKVLLVDKKYPLDQIADHILRLEGLAQPEYRFLTSS